MLVPVLLKVPTARAMRLLRRVGELQEHVRSKNMIDVITWRKITMPNLLRVALQVGFPRMDKMSNDQLIVALKREGVLRGRPRGS